MFRMFGVIITFMVVLILMKSALVTHKQITKKVNADPVMQEQQKILKAQGVDATDQKALEKYATEQMKQIQEYQNQQVVPNANGR